MHTHLLAAKVVQLPQGMISDHETGSYHCCLLDLSELHGGRTDGELSSGMQWRMNAGLDSSGIKENLAAKSVASQPAIAGTKGCARQAASVETL